MFLKVSQSVSFSNKRIEKNPYFSFLLIVGGPLGAELSLRVWFGLVWIGSGWDFGWDKTCWVLDVGLRAWDLPTEGAFERALPRTPIFEF